MKRNLLMIALLLISLNLKAQTSPVESKPDSVFTNVDEYPEYPGGIEKLYDLLVTVLHYPDSARMNKITGKVFVGFVVEKDGTLSNFNIVRGVSSDINAEAIRAMKLTPKWKPGSVGGKLVRTRYTVPISFTLAEEIFEPIEVSAEYPGGFEKLYKYLMTNLKYPKKAKDEQLEGKVMVSFVVEKDGSLTDIKVLRSLSAETDAEAIRLIKGSVKWKPAEQKGMPVRQQYTLPVNFNLSDR